MGPKIKVKSLCICCDKLTSRQIKNIDLYLNVRQYGISVASDVSLMTAINITLKNISQELPVIMINPRPIKQHITCVDAVI